MKAEDLTKMLVKLGGATKNAPSGTDIEMLTECILDNRLTDEEILRGYRLSRDAAEPWWPKPGEFLARARPAVTPESRKARFSGEAEGILASLLDSPQLYGKYNPHAGIVHDRRKVEEIHGPAAGRAFAAIQSRIRFLDREDPLSMTFLRRDFLEAYDAVREDLPEPLALPSSVAPRALPAAKAEAAPPSKAEDEAFMAELASRVPETVAPAMSEVDWEARRQSLLAQAKDLS